MSDQLLTQVMEEERVLLHNNIPKKRSLHHD
jgi:hypothetical protein